MDGGNDERRAKCVREPAFRRSPGQFSSNLLSQSQCRSSVGAPLAEREEFLQVCFRKVNFISTAQLPSSEREEVTHAIDLPWNR